MFDMNSDPMLVLDGNGATIIINTAFADLVGIAEEDTMGRDLLGQFVCLPDQTALTARLKTAVENDLDFIRESVELDCPGGARTYTVTGSVIAKGDESPHHVLVRFTEEG